MPSLAFVPCHSTRCAVAYAHYSRSMTRTALGSKPSFSRYVLLSHFYRPPPLRIPCYGHYYPRHTLPAFNILQRVCLFSAGHGGEDGDGRRRIVDQRRLRTKEEGRPGTADEQTNCGRAEEDAGRYELPSPPPYLPGWRITMEAGGKDTVAYGCHPPPPYIAPYLCHRHYPQCQLSSSEQHASTSRPNCHPIYSAYLLPRLLYGREHCLFGCAVADMLMV